MKKIFFFLLPCSLFFAPCVLSQNVGIGTATPSFKLDVKTGSINTDSVYRIGGNTVLSINGSANTFVGIGCGNATTTGPYNTANGYQALYSNNTGSQNIANGYRALYSNTSGSGNIANGFGALYSNTTGSVNVGNGNQALYSNTTASFNVAIGHEALYSNTTGQFNTADGTDALYRNTIGDHNTANGHQALYSNTIGVYNTANGLNALYSNSAGNYNIASGSHALQNTTTSSYNVAVGYAAGDGFNNGSLNVFVGEESDATVAGLSNIIVVGQGTVVGASNLARFGNAGTTSYGGYAAWSNFSDGRYKKNIKEDVPGLAFINKLRPVTYNLDARGLDAFLHKNNKSQLSTEAKSIYEKALLDKEKIIYTGFIAQEVESTAKQLGFDFSGVDAPKNENDTYGLRYAEFVVPLVKAVQELAKENDELRKQNQALLKRLEKIELLLAK